MPYITINDDISALPLSVRSQNCLRNADIYTIGAMLDYPIDEFINIRNMGKKSITEIYSFIQKLREGTGEFVLVEASDASILDSATFQENQECAITVFVDETGSIIQDIPIKDMPLSVRAINSLTNNGYEFASQLVGITFNELMNLQNMGKKTAEQVLEYMAKISIKHETITKNTTDFSIGNELTKEMCAIYGQEENVWLKEILTIKEQFPEALGETLIYRLYDIAFVRGIVKARILKFVEESGGKISRSLLEEYLPQHLNNTTIIDEILLELESISAIEMGDVLIYRQYPSIVQYIAQLSGERERHILQARLDGRTLQEIGDQYGITRERVRQLIQKTLKKKPYLSEDKYLYIYSHYDISLEDFMLAFGEPKETYYYLEVVCQANRSERKPLEEILTDIVIAPEYRKKAERAIYKHYVSIDGVHVQMTRPTLVKHFIKTYCKNQTDYDLFFQQYHEWLNTLDISDTTSLEIKDRTYVNILNQCDYVLWNQWRSFRYYNISEHDFGEMFLTLDLEQFEDTEFSTLRLFRDYPDLMQQYDIHDEYELHNLLKKIWPVENSSVKFKRMPTVEVGNADVSNQVISLLLQHAPISIDDLASRYEEEYGVKASSVKSNYFGAINHYLHQGSYSVDYADLPSIQFERLKSVLDRDFYTIRHIKMLYKREFPDSQDSLLNPYTLKTLGFHVYPGYSGYIVKTTFSGATDYFRSILTKDDIVDMKNYDDSIRNIATYNNEQSKLRAAYEIIEFSPLQYINIRRLNEAGITKEYLKAYCNTVAHHYEKGEYFTITSLRKGGFRHKIDDLGFDEWFYSSILLEDRQLFSYQKIGGTRIFLRGKNDANLGGMLVWILEKYKKIDFYDLVDLLENYYGIKIPKEKLRSIIDGTDLYYDSIMEAVYIDYDTYFEEI